jgi:hypothetical protein
LADLRRKEKEKEKEKVGAREGISTYLRLHPKMLSCGVHVLGRHGGHHE